MDKKVVILDTETNWFVHNEIIQLAYVMAHWYWYNSLRERSIYFSAENPIDIEAMAVHHITEDKIFTMPRFSLDSLIQAIWEDSIIVAHNAQFDIGVLRKYGEVKNPHICTMKLAVSLQRWPKVSLQYLRYAIWLSQEWKAHDALWDAVICHKLFEHLRDTIIAEKGMSLDEFYDYAIGLSMKDMFNFGKHKWKFMEEVKKEDPWYFRWLIDAENRKESPDQTQIWVWQKYL